MDNIVIPKTLIKTNGLFGITILALKLAAKAGINAAFSTLVDCAGTSVAMMRRFDRTVSGDRLMYVSAATMLGAEATNPAEHSYTDLVDILRVHGAATQKDIEELWRRIAFSILITNVDDHLLNHGFIHVENGKWRLAPAFDINPFPERHRELKTWISETSGPEATIKALLSVHKYFRLEKERAVQIIKEVDNAVAAWRNVGRRIGMSASELDQFEAAFEHVEREAVKQV